MCVYDKPIFLCMRETEKVKTRLSWIIQNSLIACDIYSVQINLSQKGKYVGSYNLVTERSEWIRPQGQGNGILGLIQGGLPTCPRGGSGESGVRLEEGVYGRVVVSTQGQGPPNHLKKWFLLMSS